MSQGYRLPISHRAQTVPPSTRPRPRAVRRYFAARPRASGVRPQLFGVRGVRCLFAPPLALFNTPSKGERRGHVCARLASCARHCAALRSIAQHCAALRAATHLPATQTPLLRTDAALFIAQWPGRHPVRPCAHGFTSCPRWSATVRSGPRGPAHDSHAMPRFDARRAWVVARRLSRRPNAHRCSHRQLSVTNAVTMRHGHLSDTPIARTRHRNDRASAEGGARIRCGPVLPTSCGCRCPPQHNTVRRHDRASARRGAGARPNAPSPS